MPKKTIKAEVTTPDVATYTVPSQSNEDAEAVERVMTRTPIPVDTVISNTVNIQTSARNKPAGLVAYAAFDCNGEHYEPGDEFTPPAGWTRDANYDEFRGIQIKNSLGKDIGRAFNTPSGLQIVPVKEA